MGRSHFQSQSETKAAAAAAAAAEPTLFKMRAYFDESMNIAMAMTTVALAIIGFSEKFDASQSYLRFVGFLLMLVALAIPVNFSIDFINYVRSTRKLPDIASKPRLYFYIACCYAFFTLIVIVTLVFMSQKILRHV